MDDSFDAFAEIEAQQEDVGSGLEEADEDSPTPSPSNATTDVTVAPNGANTTTESNSTNTTEIESAAHKSISATVVSLLVGAITLLNFC